MIQKETANTSTVRDVGSIPIRSNQARFLHIVPDDKFIDSAHELFEEAMPGGHDFLLITSEKQTRFIRRFAPQRTTLQSALSRPALQRLSGYAAVFVHFLSQAARAIVASAPIGTTFVWIGWGGDYYHLISSRERLLLPETRALLACIDAARGWRQTRPTDILRSFLRVLQDPQNSLRRLVTLYRMRKFGAGRSGEAHLLDRFTLFAPILREDYEAIAIANPGFPPRFFSFNYWTEGFELLSNAPPRPPVGRNVLLGNSATPENNHVEAMNLLVGIPAADQKIICPLSYGDASYGDAIADHGARLFGAGFVPLRDFLDGREYLDVLMSCSVVAMNHIRQQALGNVLLMLWLGARVFLNHLSPVRLAMSRIGIETHDIRDLPGYLRLDAPPCPETDIVALRERITRHFGRTSMVVKTQSLLDGLLHKRF